MSVMAVSHGHGILRLRSDGLPRGEMGVVVSLRIETMHLVALIFFLGRRVTLQKRWERENPV